MTLAYHSESLNSIDSIVGLFTLSHHDFYNVFMQLTKKLKINSLYLLGVFDGFIWIIDTYIKIFVTHTPKSILWWSSTSLGITAIGLIKRNSFLLTSMFCAVVFHEIIWYLSFFSNLFYSSDPFVFTGFLFVPGFPMFRWIIASTYHFLIIPSLIFGILQIKRIHTAGWIGAIVFAFTVELLAYIYPANTSNVNCVHREIGTACTMYFGWLYGIQNDYVIIIIATLAQALFIFIPVNLILIKIAKVRKWKIDKEIFKKRV